MQFVFNPNPLPISTSTRHKKAEGIQYYEWRYKQKIAQQEKQLKRITKLLQNIEEQEQAYERQNGRKKRLREQETFYDYSMNWKKKIQSKIEEQKTLKNIQITKNQNNLMKQQTKQEKKQLNKEYKGPIDGWQEHFENYIKNRSIGMTMIPQQVTFQPKINEKSKKLAQGMTGKVQDRLIMFGQFVKMKIKNEQINQMSQIGGNTASKTQKYYTNASNHSQIFYRLYKQGEEMNKRKRQMAMDDYHTFKPKVNKLSEQIQDKIMKKRKPLYYVKQQNEKKNDKANQSTNKKVPKGDFESFLKRNQALLNMRKKLLVENRQNLQQKQNLQRSKCTFAPSLNNKSIKLNKVSKEENQEFQSKMISEIKLSMQNDNIPINPMENIDISKLTIVQPKYLQDSDSLSAYKLQTQVKESQKFKKQKQKQYDTTKCQQTDRQTTLMKNTKAQKIQADKDFASEQKTIKICEQDSIQNMRNHQWESQLEEIQNHIHNMMSRAAK